jgi:hypothetical protein
MSISFRKSLSRPLAALVAAVLFGCGSPERTCKQRGTEPPRRRPSPAEP